MKLYLRVRRTPLVRRMPLGVYLYVPSSARLETYSPIMEIDESTEELLALCDGTCTREEILQVLSEKGGEPVEAFEKDFDEFVDYLVGEGVLEWRKNPSPVEPLYKGDRPHRILIDVTSACDLQCPFCQADSKTLKNELTFSDISHFVEQVKKLNPSLLTISGGEPLLKKDIVLYMVEELSPLKEMGLYILTNATVITKEYAQQLYDAGLRSVRVCVDGHCDEVHDAIKGEGTFKKTIQGIEYLRDVGIHVTVVSMISKMNYPYFKEVREFVSKIADGYTLVFDFPCGKGSSDLLLNSEERTKVRLYDLGSEDIETGVFPQSRCHIGEILYITANGDCFPCLYMNFPEFKEGNIKENDLLKIYKNEVLQSMLQVTVSDIEQCKDCDIRYYCRGGCRGHSYGECSSLYVPDPFDCEMNKAAVQRILEHGEENTKNLMEELIESTKKLK